MIDVIGGGMPSRLFAAFWLLLTAAGMVTVMLASHRALNEAIFSGAAIAVVSSLVMMLTSREARGRRGHPEFRDLSEGERADALRAVWGRSVPTSGKALDAAILRAQAATEPWLSTIPLTMSGCALLAAFFVIAGYLESAWWWGTLAVEISMIAVFASVVRRHARRAEELAAIRAG